MRAVASSSRSKADEEIGEAGVNCKRGRPKLLREGKVSKLRKIFVTEQTKEVLNEVTACAARDPLTVEEAMADGCLTPFSETTLGN